MTKLEKIVKEAQKLRKAHPKKYAKWTDYIKAASKSIAGYTGTKRSGSTTTVNYTRKTAVKKSKPATQARLFGAKKVAGTDNNKIFEQQLKQALDNLRLFEAGIVSDTWRSKDCKLATEKAYFRAQIKRKREAIAITKKQIALIKKAIK
jgi:hypothetical protein